jgi:HK97 gp10 family phage protein
MGLAWYGDKWLENFRQEQVKRLNRAAIYLEGKVKEALGVKGAPLSGRDSGGRFVRANCEPSQSGDFPHLQTGNLRRSITHEVDGQKLIARVGTNAIYSKFLELGTSKMQPRPFLQRVLDEHRAELRAILAGKMPPLLGK